MTKDLLNGLDGLKLNPINFALASLTLGLFCKRSSSQHSSLQKIFHSIVHEGAPMIVYSQILIWGQSSVCLLLCTIMNSIPTTNKSFPNLFSGMVPLWIEAGPDVIPTAVYKNLWSQTVVQEAETLGLFTYCIMYILVISAKQYYTHDTVDRVTGKASDGEHHKVRKPTLSVLLVSENSKRFVMGLLGTCPRRSRRWGTRSM
jgi:hypothetical protein